MNDVHEHDREGSGRRLVIALLLNVGITVAQVIGGLMAGSLSLLADAAHNGSDAAALGISYGARRVARRPADRRRTFGYERAKLVGAMVNLTVLLVIGLYLVYAAVRRFVSPAEVEGVTMLVIGGIAFVEDALSTWLLYRDIGSGQNIRAAFIHLFADTLATVGVMAGALFILLFDVYWVDPAVTVAIAGYILVHGYLEIRKTIVVLMESAPADFDFDAMVRAVEAVDGVRDVHHVHVWRLDEKRVAMEAHVAVATRHMEVADRIKKQVKERLKDFAVDHATLEIEPERPSDHPRSVIAEE